MIHGPTTVCGRFASRLGTAYHRPRFGLVERLRVSLQAAAAPGCVWRDKAFRNKNLSFAVQDVQDRQLIRSLIHVYRGPQAKQSLTVAAEEACISRS